MLSTTPDLRRNQPRDLTWLVVVSFTFVWTLFIHARSYSANDASRLAAIESLVHRGAWAIDDSSFATVDKINVAGHFYSDKSPLMSLIGAGVYFVLHRAFGLTLIAGGCPPELVQSHCRAVLDLTQADGAYVALTFLMVSAPATLMLAHVYRLARQSGWPNWGGLAFVALLGLGTAIFPFSTVFSNHVPAAATVVVAVSLLLGLRDGRRVPLALAGACLALGTALDPFAGIFWLAVFFYVVLRYRRQAFWFAAGSLPLALLAAVLNYQIVGNPLPPQLYAPGYAYEGSAFPAVATGARPPGDVSLYAFNLLVGERGFLAFYPIVLWYLWSAIRSASRPASADHGLARIILGASLLFVAYFVFFTDNYGGYAYSPRWLLIPASVLAMFPVLEPFRLSRWQAGLIGALAALSLFSGYQGALNPWTPALPLLHLAPTLRSAQPRREPAVCLSGYDSIDDVALNPRKLLGTNEIQPRVFDARRGWVAPQGLTWWFLHASTPVAPELAGPLGLGGLGTFALQADLTRAARQWLATFRIQAAQSPTLVPALDQPPSPIALPVTFGGDLTLLGYIWQHRDSESTLITAWQIETTPTHGAQRSIFLHALNSGGQTVRQGDDFAAKYDTLRSGDLLFQVQVISWQDIPPGVYWFQIGVYDPVSLQRLSTPDGADRLLLTQVKK